MFSKKEVYTIALSYFNQDDLAANVWMDKYALKDQKGNFLENSPIQMHQRMAKEFARIENLYPIQKNKNNHSEYGQTRNALNEEIIFSYFDKFKYLIPQGSVMSNLGNSTSLASLSNCVVLPELFDSYGGILFADQQLAQLFKRRCGVGLDISSLRPNNSFVSNAAKSTSGAVSFMERFSNTTREVSQNGRRGALMITIDVRHPDIFDFVNIKSDLKKVTGANISIKLTDDFMDAVRGNKTFTLQWPIDSTSPSIVKEIKAKDLWNKIIQNAHKSAEPGLLFWDRQHLYSTSSIYPKYKNQSTNPCSEIAMQGGDSCRLMAINLLSFVENPFTAHAKFNFNKLLEITYEGMRLMDNLVDLELESVAKIIEKIKADKEPNYIKQCELDTWELLYKNGKLGRRTGLGFTALADCIAALGLKLDSEDAMLKIDAIMRIKCQAEFDCSIDLAIERGAFDGFDPYTENLSEFVKMLSYEFPDLHERMLLFGRRNVSISTVAPTGTLSILTQTSSGIEPVYLLEDKRRRKINDSQINHSDKDPVKKTVKDSFKDDLGDLWEEYKVEHLGFQNWKKNNPDLDKNLSPYFNCTANEIDWEKRILLQQIVQKYTTHSISSTVNLPNSASEKLVGEIYLKAWEKGLKGITVYRDGSRDGVLVSNNVKKPNERPEILPCDILHFTNNNEKWVAVIGLFNQIPYEIFTGKNDGDFKIPKELTSGFVHKIIGGITSRYDLKIMVSDTKSETLIGLSAAFNPEYWNYAKLISGILKQGMPISEVVNLIESLNLTDNNINTWKNGVKRALSKYIPKGEKVSDSNCPNCSTDNLIYEEGCVKCTNCGHSECS